MTARRRITRLQERALEAVAARHPEPLSVYGNDESPKVAICTARSLERRGLVEIGNTTRRGPFGKEYLVGLTSAGRAESGLDAPAPAGQAEEGGRAPRQSIS